MIASVTVDAEGCVTATLDSDDLPPGLAGLTADDLPDQVGRAAVATWISMHCDPEPSDESSEALDEN